MGAQVIEQLERVMPHFGGRMEEPEREREQPALVGRELREQGDDLLVRLRVLGERAKDQGRFHRREVPAQAEARELVRQVEPREGRVLQGRSESLRPKLGQSGDDAERDTPELESGRTCW